MRQINLIPSEIAERRRARQITLMLGAAGLALIGVLVLIFIIQAARLSGERGNLEAQERTNQRLQRRVTQLQGFAQLQQTLRTKEQLLGQLTANEVRWSLLLNNISLVIPSDVWLTNFSGSVQLASGPTTPTTTGPVGTIQVSGSTFTHLDVARWLSRLSGVDEFLFPYLSLSSKAASETTTLVDFNSSVQLSQESLRRNQPGGQRRP
jgi:Tfp pilus assembly protein PilN